MTDTSGLSADGQVAAIETVISGGFELALLPSGHSIGYADAVADVETAAARTETVAESDVTINTAADFSGAGALELTVDVTYSAVDEGVLDDFALLGTTAWILGEEIPGAPDTTGEDLTILSGETLYEIGNP
jgi:hypothetical protein